jgi:hypothetical protein
VRPASPIRSSSAGRASPAPCSSRQLPAVREQTRLGGRQLHDDRPLSARLRSGGSKGRQPPRSPAYQKQSCRSRRSTSAP